MKQATINYRNKTTLRIIAQFLLLDYRKLKKMKTQLFLNFSTKKALFREKPVTYVLQQRH